MKRAHDRRRAAKVCINDDAHGKPYKGGRCRTCWDSKLAAERLARAVGKAQRLGRPIPTVAPPPRVRMSPEHLEDAAIAADPRELEMPNAWNVGVGGVSRELTLFTDSATRPLDGLLSTCVNDSPTPECPPPGQSEASGPGSEDCHACRLIAEGKTIGCLRHPPLEQRGR